MSDSDRGLNFIEFGLSFLAKRKPQMERDVLELRSEARCIGTGRVSTAYMLATTPSSVELLLP